jgi:hypothetical protein
MITNLPEIRKAHAQLVESTHSAIRFVMREATREADSHVRTQAKFRHRTGRVARGTRGKYKRTKSGGRLRLTNKARHAKFLEFGTKPHAIHAKRAKYLRFFLRGGGPAMLTYRKRVWHPGNRAYKFLEAAATSAHRVAGGTLRRRMNAIARRF